MSVNICFMYLDVPILGPYMFMNVISSSYIDLFIIIQYPLFSFVIDFVLKSTLSDMSIATLPFFSFPFSWNIFFHSLIFSICVPKAEVSLVCRTWLDLVVFCLFV